MRSSPGASERVRPLADNKTHPKASGGVKILARVDLPALLRGYAVGDEACELAGYGPVAVSAIRDLMETADPFLAAVVTKGKDVVGVAHLGRRPTAPSTAPRVALPDVRGRGLHQPHVPGDRPPPGLGQDPHHRVRTARPALPPPSRPQDQRELGPRRGPRQTSLRPARRPAPSPQRPPSTCRGSVTQGAASPRTSSVSASPRNRPR
jgi:hypothetical protein